ncbi:hypothetical protein [Caldimonas brevitalea]|uniref:Cytochrome c domain-containing protein n=1 Tax=Caldimonas brevitalea TaxID=413882 RepID=A0A0G3BDV0_9BURK|nr:hypothetical protein [Caldimonas brevitalea]AKJ27594.1 hypothetical protein AAW51_0903 [Caldimonas brevitalea]
MTRPSRLRERRRPVLGGLLALGLYAPVQASEPGGLVNQGAALFHGLSPLQGRIAGHSGWLPPATLVCANCHAAPAGRSFEPGRAARPLGRTELLQPRVRRTGPPSSYTEQSLCEALRAGIDPAHVTLQRAMPRYQLSAVECRALWAFLTRPGVSVNTLP